MDIKIQGRNIEVTPRLESYIERKVARLDRYLPDIHDVRVDLADEGGNRRTAQITVRHARGKILRAEERTNDLLGAVDSVVDKLYRQIEKYKGKRRPQCLLRSTEGSGCPFDSRSDACTRPAASLTDQRFT